VGDDMNIRLWYGVETLYELIWSNVLESEEDISIASSYKLVN